MFAVSVHNCAWRRIIRHMKRDARFSPSSPGTPSAEPSQNNIANNATQLDPDNPGELQFTHGSSPHDIEAERKSRLEYLHSIMPEHRKPSWLKRLAKIVVALVILAAAGYGTYWFMSRPSSKPAATHKTTTTTSTPATVPTKKYTSTDLGLSFAYPETWTVAEPSGAALTATSPVMQLADSTGKKVNAEVVMTISPQGQGLSAFDKGAATAVLDSQKISYTQPTSSQRAQTYLSYLQYASTPAGNALDAMYITGDYGYQKDQDIPKTDAANLNPLVTVTFVKCGSNSQACATGATAMNVSATSWSAGALNKTVTTMLESLAFN